MENIFLQCKWFVRTLISCKCAGMNNKQLLKFINSFINCFSCSQNSPWVQPAIGLLFLTSTTLHWKITQWHVHGTAKQDDGTSFGPHEGHIPHVDTYQLCLDQTDQNLNLCYIYALTYKWSSHRFYDNVLLHLLTIFCICAAFPRNIISTN